MVLGVGEATIEFVAVLTQVVALLERAFEVSNKRLLL